MILRRTKVEIAAVLALAVAAVAGTRSWLAQRDLRVHAETIQEAQKQLQAQYQKQINDLGRQISDREAVYLSASKAQAKQFQRAVTPEQVADLLSKTMALRQPIAIVQAAPTPEQPTPSPKAELSVDDLPLAKVYLEGCEQCKLERDKLTADMDARAAQAALAEKQIDSLKVQRDTWKQTAMGGTFWHRLIKAARFVVLGAGAGAVAGAVAICKSGHCK